nr:L,D-transpeptidase family protein [Sulfoacidibacillus ferrooxidans]
MRCAFSKGDKLIVKIRTLSLLVVLSSLLLSGCQTGTNHAVGVTPPAPIVSPVVHHKKQIAPQVKTKPKLVTLLLNTRSKAVYHLQKELQTLHDYSYPTITGYFGVYTEGAVMTYEYDHHLKTNGIATPQLLQLIAHSVKKDKGKDLPGPYHIIVKEDIPERLYLYEGSKLILSSLCNTGIAGARTPIGSFPIYLKYRSQTMRGQNPNGTYYDDPGIPWINYFSGGCAVHGFIRSKYGFPQSVGCVELPPPIAKRVYALVPIGAIVTVEAGPATS